MLSSCEMGMGLDMQSFFRMFRCVYHFFRFGPFGLQFSWDFLSRKLLAHRMIHPDQPPKSARIKVLSPVCNLKKLKARA